MDAKTLILVALVLYAIGALCLKNTHLSAGSRSDNYESKKLRRMIGMLFLAAGTFVVGLAFLIQYFLNQN